MTVTGPLVSVRGEVVREVEPELASFTVVIAARDRDRQATLTRLRERAESLGALLDQHADAIERRETTGVRVFPETGKRGERVTAYSGSVSTTVTVHDFTALGELMLRLSDQDQTQLHGPWWSLRPDSPVHREARHAAIADAITRAREYAEAVGAALDHLVELADPGVSRGVEPMDTFAIAEGPQTMRSMGGGAPDLHLDPQRQSVHAAIEARFTITPPTAL